MLLDEQSGQEKAIANVRFIIFFSITVACFSFFLKEDQIKCCQLLFSSKSCV